MRLKSFLLSIFFLPLFFYPPFAFSKQDTTLVRPSSPHPGDNTAGGMVVRQNGTEAPLGSPTRAIQDLEAKMDDYKTGPSLTEQDKAHNTQIKRDVINGTFDIRELCRLALGNHWNSISAAEQNHFVSLMTQLLEKKAILSKEQGRTQGKKYFLNYTGETYLDPQKTRSKVQTKIHVPKEDAQVSIAYKLTKTGNHWKIFDVIVDDASLVDNYKYQFNSIITKHGYGELVSRINKKLQ